MGDDELHTRAENLKKRAEAAKPHYPEVTFKQFLEETPPDSYVRVIDLKQSRDPNHLIAPGITFYCENENTCAGPRVFRCDGNIFVSDNRSQNFLRYSCRNCGTRMAIFAISIQVQTWPKGEADGSGVFNKLGQIPPFGPQTPPRLITLIGADREMFLQGRRAENRGMGIGTFAYYRRVVENQKNRIIAEIARVAKTLGSTPETDALFEAATKETRFHDSLAMVKDAIPQTLMISGQNPLILLHSALSKGLHDEGMTDDRCLQLAQSIRTVLAELAERAAAALKSDKDIQTALSTLMSAQSIPKTGKGPFTKDSAEARQPEDAKKNRLTIRARKRKP
jgi:hypothetical protein